MSYVNQDLLKMQKRRHSIRRVTPEEAIEKANEAIDEANHQIAKAVAFGQQWQQVAAELHQENQVLRQQVAELEGERVEQEAEIARLRRKVGRKAGKKKGEEWEDET